MKCPSCGSELYYYEFRLYAYENKINKDNTISKRGKYIDEPYFEDGMASGIACRQCEDVFDHDTDEDGKINNLTKRVSALDKRWSSEKL